MYKRKSTGARLLALLIGISPLPGSPPAAYGSIIMPEAFHRRIRSNRIFRKGIRIARLLVFLFALRDRRVLAYLSPAGLFAPLRNVPVECLLSCQCAVEGLFSFHHPLLTFLPICPKKLLKFSKIFSPPFSAHRKNAIKPSLMNVMVQKNKALRILPRPFRMFVIYFSTFSNHLMQLVQYMLYSLIENIKKKITVLHTTAQKYVSNCPFSCI